MIAARFLLERSPAARALVPRSAGSRESGPCAGCAVFPAASAPPGRGFPRQDAPGGAASWARFSLLVSSPRNRTLTSPRPTFRNTGAVKAHGLFPGVPTFRSCGVRRARLPELLGWEAATFPVCPCVWWHTHFTLELSPCVRKGGVQSRGQKTAARGPIRPTAPL